MRSQHANGMTATMMLTGHTRASTARACGPTKEQEGVHGSRQQDSTQSSSHEGETRTRHDDTQMFAAGWLETTNNMRKSVGRSISGRRLFAHPELEAE